MEIQQNSARLTTLSRRTIYTQSPYLQLELHRVQVPDGRVIENWPWLEMPDFINVAPITATGKLLCFRQTKYALEGLSLAAIGGYLQPAEPPLAGAQRELLEETGLAADEWTPLGRFQVDANRGAGRAHFFIARGLRPQMRPESDDLEPQELVELLPAEARRALAAGEFKVLSWAALIAMTLERL